MRRPVIKEDRRTGRRRGEGEEEEEEDGGRRTETSRTALFKTSTSTQEGWEKIPYPGPARGPSKMAPGPEVGHRARPGDFDCYLLAAPGGPKT